MAKGTTSRIRTIKTSCGTTSIRNMAGHREVLRVDSMACDSHHGDCDHPNDLFHIMCGGLVSEIFAYEYYSMSVAAP